VERLEGRTNLAVRIRLIGQGGCEHMRYNLASAERAGDDTASLVFGAAAPPTSRSWDGDGRAEIDEWIEFMKAHGIQRVVCLLPPNQLERYYSGGLVNHYQQAFGEDKVLHKPVEEMRLADLDTLLAILDFLEAADHAGERTLVHCLAGIVATPLSIPSRRYGRSPGDPLEATRGRGATVTREDVLRLIDEAKQAWREKHPLIP